jgi:hypothetical protein
VQEQPAQPLIADRMREAQIYPDSAGTRTNRLPK